MIRQFNSAIFSCQTSVNGTSEWGNEWFGQSVRHDPLAICVTVRIGQISEFKVKSWGPVNHLVLLDIEMTITVQLHGSFILAGAADFRFKT